MLMRMNRNRIIRGIARNCTPYLVTGYGSQSAYSQGQIDTAMSETGCNSSYIDYAYAMFGRPEEFPDDSSTSYNDACDVVGEVFFGGNNEFSAQDFISSSSSFESSFGSDGVSDGGGDGD